MLSFPRVQSWNVTIDFSKHKFLWIYTNAVLAYCCRNSFKFTAMNIPGFSWSILFAERERATVSTSLMESLRYPALDCAEVTTSTFLIPASFSKGSTDQCLIVVAKLIFGKLKVLISGSEFGLSVTEPKKLSHHSISHLWDSLTCHFSKIERILGFWSAVTS